MLALLGVQVMIQVPIIIDCQCQVGQPVVSWSREIPINYIVSRLEVPELIFGSSGRLTFFDTGIHLLDHRDDETGTYSS